MGREFDLADFIITILFTFVYIMIGAIAINNAVKLTINYFKSKNFPNLFLTIIFYGFVFWLIVIIFPYAKYVTGYLFNVSYMLPEPAKYSVISIKINPSALRYQEPDMYAISGVIYLRPDAKFSDYEIILYKKLEGLSNYEINYYSGDPHTYYRVPIKSNGEFLIPMINIKRLDNLNELYSLC